MDGSSQYLLEIGERMGSDYLRNAPAIFLSVVVGVKFETETPVARAIGLSPPLRGVGLALP